MPNIDAWFCKIRGKRALPSARRRAKQNFWQLLSIYDRIKLIFRAQEQKIFKAS
jgi:hypothetical protein